MEKLNNQQIIEALQKTFGENAIYGIGNLMGYYR